MENNSIYKGQFDLCNEPTYEAVFSKYHSALVFFANRLVQNKPQAEDIVVEVCISLWERCSCFFKEPSIKAYLYISVRNKCLNYLKQDKNQAKCKVELQDKLDASHEDFVLNEIIRTEVLRGIREMLEKLPQECRKIIRMKYVDGLNNQEIAMKLNISIHTVKNQVARGIYLMKKRIANRSI